MRTTYHILTSVIIVTVMLTLASCQHKELCYNHAHTVRMNVVFDWTSAQDANPATMSLYLFPKEGGEPLRYEFTDRKGGEIKVPYGSYDAICLNSDTEGNIYRNTGRYSTFEITTQTTDLLSSAMPGLVSRVGEPPRAEGTESERVVMPTDTLWTGTMEDIELSIEDTVSTITMYPEDAISRYRVEIINGENLKYTTGISAALTGMSAGLLPGAGTLSNENVTIPFVMSVVVPEEGEDAGQEVVTGKLTTFGHCPHGDGQHTLIVYAILADGSKYAYTFDAAEVTAQIHSAPDPRNVLIRLDGLPLPEPITNGGGFQPEVEGWESEEIGLKM